MRLSTLSGYIFIHFFTFILKLCVSCGLYGEWNHRILEGEDLSILELKPFFLHTLFDWMSVMSGLSFSLLVKFLDL